MEGVLAREERRKAGGAATPWEMRVASTPAARRRVSEFAYRILSADLGGRIAAADHAARRLDDPMDDVALHLIASRQSRIEGTLRVMIGAGPVLTEELRSAYSLARFADFRQSELIFVDRLLIDRSANPELMAAALEGHAYRIACREGGRFLFTHSAPSMVSDYLRYGYRHIGGAFQEPEYGSRIPLCLVLGDEKHLGRINSPFLALARPLALDGEATAWFSETFANAN